jgi:hypothetical protein
MTGEDIDLVIKALTLVVGTIVALFGIWRFTQEKRKDRRVLAREKFDDYLGDARDHIKYMMGFWPPKEGTSDEDILGYRLFIARVMWACEEALLAFPDDDWEECINEQLEFHRNYYRTPEFRRHMATLHPVLQEHLRNEGFVPAE